MNNIKMIVTDLDRTLLRKDKGLSEYTKSILTKCYQSGIIIVFATARPERATRQLQLNELLSFVISNNGATITSGNECIKNILIPKKTKNNLIKQLTDNDNISAITVEVGDFLYTNDKEYRIWSLEDNWNPVITDFHTAIKEDTCKISVECADIELILNIIRNYPDVYLLPNNGEIWHQIMHSTSSKFNSISFLSKHTGIALADIISFGDDYNDVEMLQKCGVGVAVKNAVIEAKAAAKFVCETNENDGVARFLEKYILCSVQQ